MILCLEFLGDNCYDVLIVVELVVIIVNMMGVCEGIEMFKLCK